MDFGSSALACISVGLELVTQYMLLAIELTHVIHTALEEWSRIDHTDALSGTKKNTLSGEKADGPTLKSSGKDRKKLQSDN